MKFESFFDNFELLTEAPNAVAQLRDIVLQLAFQGKLTQQLDEKPTAIEVLKEIQKDTGAKYSERRAKKSNLKLDPFDCEGIFEIPESWEWTYLDFICEKIGYIDHKMPKAVARGVPFLSAKDLKDDGTLDFSNPKYISEEDYERLSGKIKPQRGDIIYSRIGAKLGKARLIEVETKFLISYSCCLIRPKHRYINAQFIQHFLILDWR